MKLLLDTHVFLWCMASPARLDAAARTGPNVGGTVRGVDAIGFGHR